MNTSSSSARHEVNLAIYDLSKGMARNMSAQLLGPEYAIEIIPHTAILAFGKEYYFGQGIEWGSPHEFRSTRGIQPIDIQPLGHTTCTEQQFEDWCRAQAASGSFGAQAYDLIHRNCNNFSEEASRQGLRLQKGVPQWILELPQKVLNSPMGMVMRPLLENMQIGNNAPTNIPTGSARMAQPATSATASPAPVAAANPWANIPVAASTSATPSVTQSNTTKDTTPLLDKQTALLSTDTGVVKICIDRLKPEQEQIGLVSKLGDIKASWTQQGINSVHQYLRAVIESNDTRHLSFALMLLRLVVLRQSSSTDMSSNAEQSQSTQLVATLLLKNKLSQATRSMAWCVLSNAMGSAQPPDWNVSASTESDKFSQMIDRALSDCDPKYAAPSTPSHIQLRQSAAAFLYNSSRRCAENCNAELSEGTMSILLGCLEHLHSETDVTTMQRLYMATGQLLKSNTSGKTAAGLVKDLGLVDEKISKGKHKEVEALAKEVTALLR